jgi:hypothetical protein
MRDSIILDIAVLGQNTKTPIELIGKTHTIELDEIEIDYSLFKTIFYHYGDNFCLAKTTSQDKIIFPYISFSPLHRKYKGVPFSLLDTIIGNIETDLDITRNCFTSCSLIDLSKEINNIKSLKNIECSYSTLTLSNIISIIKDTYTAMIGENILKYIILVISVIFKSPDPNILPVIIKFRYKININNFIFV